MFRMIAASAVLFIGSALAYGETFTGRLVDANCSAQQQSGSDSTCAPTSSTSAFALQVSGKMLRLDADGNRKAADAIKASGNSADRAKDPDAAKSGQVMASVQGTLNGDEIKVDTVTIQ